MSAPESASSLPPSRSLPVGPLPSPPRAIVFDFDGTLSLIRGGWADIMIPMMVELLQSMPLTTESPDELVRYVRKMVMNNNGRPTIYQMIDLGNEVHRRGGNPATPEEYANQFMSQLLAMSEQRCQDILHGRCGPDEFLVPGARELLHALHEAGVELTLASGTEEVAVRREAALLRIDHYFEGRIHGPVQENPHAFSKLEVMRKLTERHQLVSHELAGFGDGAVEIESLKQLGGFAVGVAIDESRQSSDIEVWKAERLTAAGVDALVPDYRQLDDILQWLGLAGTRPVTSPVSVA